MAIKISGLIGMAVGAALSSQMVCGEDYREEKNSSASACLDILVCPFSDVFGSDLHCLL